MNKLLTVLLLCLNVQAYAQISKKDLLGQWFLSKSIKDSVTIFDESDERKFIDDGFQQYKKYNPIITKEDSVAKTEAFKLQFQRAGKTYYIFKDDNSFEAGAFKRRNPETINVHGGLYEFDSERQILIQKEKDDIVECKLNLIDNKLIFTFLNGTNLTFVFRR